MSGFLAGQRPVHLVRIILTIWTEWTACGRASVQSYPQAKRLMWLGFGELSTLLLDSRWTAPVQFKNLDKIRLNRLYYIRTGQYTHTHPLHVHVYARVYVVLYIYVYAPETSNPSICACTPSTVQFGLNSMKHRQNQVDGPCPAAVHFAKTRIK